MGLDHEAHAGRAQPLGERLPFVHRQHHAEVAHRHLVAVDRVGRGRARLVGGEMRDDLVAVEVEVDPLGRTAPFRASEQAAVESPRSREIVDGKRQVKRVDGHSVGAPRKRRGRAGGNGRAPGLCRSGTRTDSARCTGDADELDEPAEASRFRLRTRSTRRQAPTWRPEPAYRSRAR